MQDESWIIYAVNIHTGGGKILLDSLLLNQAIGPVCALFADHRYKPSTTQNYDIFYAKNSVIDRLKAEYNLHQYVKTLPKNKTYRILFFGNLPPLVKPQLASILYLQNCYLTRQMPLPKDSILVTLRNFFESQILKIFAKNVNEIWVQTAWMKKMTQAYLPKAVLSIKPLLPHFAVQANSQLEKKYDFIYVGSLCLNKRFNFFIEALSKLDQELKKKINVVIILDNTFLDLDMIKFSNIELKILFKISHETLSVYYTQSKNFVLTSLYESFCLPLYEAKYYGCHIIAPTVGYTENLDFEFTAYKATDCDELADKMASLSLIT